MTMGNNGNIGDVIVVTTSYRVTAALEAEARAFAHKWGWPYVQRADQSINELKKRYRADQIIVLSQEGGRWVGQRATFNFHPSLAVVRIKRLMRGDTDVLKSVAGLKAGDAFLDTTLGFGADAITAAHIVGKSGKVIGLESDRRIAALVEYGLRHFPVEEAEVRQAMRKIRVHHTDHLTYLSHCPDNAFDIVYFDPMFRTSDERSQHMKPLRTLANRRPISKWAVAEACRVARKRVVLKEKVGSEEFARLGFEVKKERRNRVSYGIIELGDSDGET